MYRFPPNIKAAMEQSVVPIAVYQFINKRVRTVLLTAGFIEMLGLKSFEEGYELMDTNMYRDTHPDDIPRIASEAIRFATNEIPVYKVIYRSKINGEYHIIHAEGRHVTTEEGERLAYVWYFDEGLFSEASGTKGGIELGYEDKLEEQANRHYYDYMTGLPLLKYFQSLAESGGRLAYEQGRRPVILYVDLCGIGDFNRRFGFEEGDRLIKALAEVLVKLFSNENCCRLSQDHFIVFTDDWNLDKRLADLFERSKPINDGKNVPIRVGVYVYRGGENNPRVASDRAKLACDAARDIPEPSVKYYDESMHLFSEKRRYIMDTFDKALSENWIKVYYQPIVRSANGRVCEEEALARWIDPRNGRLLPDEFVPVLEEEKLIYKLDLHVLEQVLDKIKQHKIEGLFTVPVSVNLSRSDFDSCDIVEEIRRRVDDSGVGRDMINIEVTESVVGSDFEFMKSQIERFKALGFKVWMDDFGRGYSSLDLLQEIGFDLIKFDMHFMKMFDKTDKTKVIITELVKMAIGLGIETIVEGVETPEQVEFLREVGCTKMQGFYFCRPIPLEELFDRYRRGVQIGFENPDETAYYSAIGKINLYDLSSVNSGDASLSQYFNTLPMTVVELSDTELIFVRNNSSYRTIVEGLGLSCDNGVKINYPYEGSIFGFEFARASRMCSEDGARQLVNEKLVDGSVAHLFIRRIAKNPTTGLVAFIVVLLEYSEFSEVSFDSEELIPTDTFVYSLAADYSFLYYVNLDSERFVEYRPDEKSGELKVIRHGSNFFEEVRKDAPRDVYKDDLEKLLTTFTRENVEKVLSTNTTLTLTYRLMVNGEPTYVNLKASPLGKFHNRAIIGVNNVDSQMKAQEAYERIKEEKLTFSRISALSGNYICIYAVNPETDQYMEYNMSKEYAGLAISYSGEHFFEDAYKNAPDAIFPGDVDRVRSIFTKKNVLSVIEKNGLFTLNYRLMMGGKDPVHVSLRAAMVTESDGPQLIIGVSNIDDQVKRDREYAYNLSQAKSRADIDALTGVKNRHAYLDFEEKLNRAIKENKNYPFAMTVFDVNDLKDVNDKEGHLAGDKYIQDASSIICKAFKHSPVFRIGGDEFVAISSGHDYDSIDSILESVDAINRENAKKGAVVVSYGMSRLSGDSEVSEIFDRADRNMYEYKKSSKKHRK